MESFVKSCTHRRFFYLDDLPAISTEFTCLYRVGIIVVLVVGPIVVVLVHIICATLSKSASRLLRLDRSLAFFDVRGEKDLVLIEFQRRPSESSLGRAICRWIDYFETVELW